MTKMLIWSHITNGVKAPHLYSQIIWFAGLTEYTDASGKGIMEYLSNMKE